MKMPPPIVTPMTMAKASLGPRPRGRSDPAAEGFMGPEYTSITAERKARSDLCFETD